MSTENAGRAIVVADLGKRKRKAVRNLRKNGDGPILDDVNELVARLERDGQVPAGAAVVVAVVERKRRSPLKMSW